MDYNNINDLINAGTTNATILVNNTKYDDNTFTINNPPNWIKFNGISATSIVASGNTFFGINSATEHITFNRRDTAMFYLYAEEGKVYGTRKFYRLCWRGYSAYNQTGSSYQQMWEVIFFDSGDFMIHGIQIPSSQYTGTFQVNASRTYSYNAPSASSRYISFYSQDINNSTFRIDYAIIQLIVPPSKFLLQDGNKYYTVVDDTLEELDISSLTAETFQTYGLDTVPNASYILQLSAPKILCWGNPIEGDAVNLLVVAKPPTQIIITKNYQFDDIDTNITNIGKFHYSGSDDVLIALSNDDGATWIKYNFDYLRWDAVTDQYDGNTTAELDRLAYNNMVGFSVNRQIKLRFVIFTNSYLNGISIDYIR